MWSLLTSIKLSLHKRFKNAHATSRVKGIHDRQAPSLHNTPMAVSEFYDKLVVVVTVSFTIITENSETNACTQLGHAVGRGQRGVAV